MRTILITGAIAALLTPDAGAQAPRPTRAFEHAVTVALGVRNFGVRARSVEGKASYSGSAELGVRGDFPITRRTAFMMDLSLAPLAKQESNRETSAIVSENLFAATVTAALAARLKARVPVFFYAGVAAIYASKPPVPIADGSSIEPALAFGAGYDALQRGPWNFRAIYSGYLLKPKDPDVAGVTVESTAYDWGFQIGARYTPSMKGARGGAR